MQACYPTEEVEGLCYYSFTLPVRCFETSFPLLHHTPTNDDGQLCRKEAVTHKQGEEFWRQ